MKFEYSTKYFNISKDNVSAKRILIDEVGKYITLHRLAHSLSVASLCFKIAYNNKLEYPLHYYFAGLVHDIAKDQEYDKMNLNKIFTKEEVACPEYCYHAFYAPIMIKEIFGVEDEELLKAVYDHCTGNVNMSPMGKVLYASDKIDPLRGYDSSELIKGMIDNYETGFITVLKENKKFIEGKTKDPMADNPLSEACYKYYLK